MIRVKRATALAPAFVMVAAVVWAQAAVTQSDLDRLQDRMTAAHRDVAALAADNASLASSLRDELDRAADEITYFKVKLRRNESVTRQDYAELRDRIDDIRNRALAPAAKSAPVPAPRPPSGASRSGANAGDVRAAASGTVPVGTQIDVRLQQTLGSDTASVNQSVEATTVADLQNDG